MIQPLSRRAPQPEKLFSISNCGAQGVYDASEYIYRLIVLYYAANFSHR